MEIKKIEWEEIFKTTTFFLIDNVIEESYEKTIKNRVKDIKKKLDYLKEPDGVRKFIIEDKDSISDLITLLGISGERFNRIVSMIRADYGYVFDGEWTWKNSIRTNLLENKCILNDVCELFEKGYISTKFSNRVPRYILRKFHIDKSTISRLNNKGLLEDLVKKKLDAEYNSKYVTSYQNIIYDKIYAITSKYGLDIVKGQVPEKCRNDVLYTISSGDKNILINASYNLTTGKGQTNYQEKITEIFRDVRINDNYLVVNMLDGAGWIARHSDCKQIYHNCHLFLNLKTIAKIEDIIKEFFNL